MSKADKTLDPIYDWFGKEMEIDEDRTTAALQAVGGVDLKGSYLQKFIGLFVTLKADIRKAGERLHRVTKEKPHRLSALAERCNVLVREVNQVLAKQNRKLLIVVEDLDKLNLGDARSMFVEQPAILSELSARVICTVPIFLLHSPDLALMEGYFDHVVLPMPRVFNLDGSPCEQGRAVIHEIIARRVRDGLIDDSALEELIVKTGGVLRDIFEVIPIAAQAAKSQEARGSQEQAVVNVDNVRYGLSRLRNKYARAISVINLPDPWRDQVTIDSLFERLRSLRDRPTKVLPSDPQTMILLQSRAIIEYNGQRWFALHPLVSEMLDDMK